MTRSEIIDHCRKGRELAALPGVRLAARGMTAADRVECDLLMIEIDREATRIIAGK